MAKMTKSMASEPMMCSSTGCGPKCIAMMLLAVLFASGSLWMLIQGIMLEWGLAPWNSVLLWFIGGFILMGIAKKCKWAACGWCSK